MNHGCHGVPKCTTKDKKNILANYPTLSILPHYLHKPGLRILGVPNRLEKAQLDTSKAEGSCAFLAEKRFPKIPKSKVRPGSNRLWDPVMDGPEPIRVEYITNELLETFLCQPDTLHTDWIFAHVATNGNKKQSTRIIQYHPDHHHRCFSKIGMNRVVFRRFPTTHCHSWMFLGPFCRVTEMWQLFQVVCGPYFCIAIMLQMVAEARIGHNFESWGLAHVWSKCVRFSCQFLSS